jgi:hypothetical protein
MGQPLANAQVTLEDESGKQYEPVSTDQAGTYALNGVKPGNYKLLVWLPGIEPSKIDVVAGPDITSIQDIEFKGKPITPFASPTVTPVPTAASEITAEEARAFVRNFWTAREKGNLESLMAAFAPQVNYYEDNIRDRNFIRKDQNNYLKAFDHRVFQLGAIDVIKGESDASDQVRVRFSFRYKVSGKKQSLSGKSTEMWVLRKSGGKLEVVDSKGQVIRD